MTEQEKCPKCDGKGTLEPTEYPRCSKCGKYEMMIGGPCGPAPHCNCWVLSEDFTGSYMGGFDSQDVLPLLRDVRSQLAQAKAQRDGLLAACERTVEWLGRLAVVADKHGTDERFPAFAEANRQDARNLRATADNIAAAIAKAAPEEDS